MKLMSLRLAPAAAAALMALSGLVQAGLVQSVMANEVAPVTPIQLAQSGQGNSQGRPQGGRPPREAFEACQSKAANDSCQVNLPDGNSMTGTCQAPPEGGDGAMACVPAGGPKPRG